MSWNRITGIIPVLVFLVAPAAVAAQRAAPVLILGQVIDDQTHRPIPGASVLVLDAFGDRIATRVADDFGRFNVEVRRASGIRVRANRIGYREATSPVLHFDGREFFAIEVRLDSEAVLLAPLEVVARSRVRRSSILTAFDDRVRTGSGVYITRTDIERMRPGYVSDLLLTVPGIRIHSGGGRGNQRVITMGRATGIDCAAQVFVDGRLMNRGLEPTVSVDDFVAPEGVEGIEIYRGLSTIPPEFLNPESRCGVVAIWTRRADLGR